MRFPAPLVAVSAACVSVACAPPAPCSPTAAYERGVQGLGLDPRCPAAPGLRTANDEGFAVRLRLDRLDAIAIDALTGRRRPTPGVIEIAPLPEAPAAAEPAK
ncbi:MAG: hypothetical protein AAF192_23335 [Pseudomonadota bacterium]